MNVQKLKQMGYRVDIIHSRIRDINALGKPEIAARGGNTIAVLKKSGHIYRGEAICSKDDNYCKSTGRKVALARALAKIPSLRDKVPNLFV
jgi:hypothetical protein